MNSQTTENLNIEEFFSSTIESQFKIISVKCNYRKDEYENEFESCGGDLSKIEPPEDLLSVSEYFRSNKVEIVYSTLGLHLNGENKKPHIHWCVIAKGTPSGTFITQNSLHRKRWVATDENNIFTMHETSIKFGKHENPVWQCLAYPLKEGLYFINSKRCKTYQKIPTVQMFNFLLEFGTNLYQVALGQAARNDACELRKQKALENLFNLCRINDSQFITYKEMLIWLDDNYLATLTYKDLPDFNHYKNNCIKVACALKIIKYSDLILHNGLC